MATLPVEVVNFKALKRVKVNLKPLTVVVGANNTGKSSFLQALLWGFSPRRALERTTPASLKDLFRKEKGKTMREVRIRVKDREVKMELREEVTPLFLSISDEVVDVEVSLGKGKERERELKGKIPLLREEKTMDYLTQELKAEVLEMEFLISKKAGKGETGAKALSRVILSYRTNLLRYIEALDKLGLDLTFNLPARPSALLLEGWRLRKIVKSSEKDEEALVKVEEFLKERGLAEDVKRLDVDYVTLKDGSPIRYENMGGGFRALVEFLFHVYKEGPSTLLLDDPTALFHPGYTAVFVKALEELIRSKEVERVIVATHDRDFLNHILLQEGKWWESNVVFFQFNKKGVEEITWKKAQQEDMDWGLDIRGL